MSLRIAREVLKVDDVCTTHNDPMIAIDRKMGYVQTPGLFTM